jgi:hypothetical protein
MKEIKYIILLINYGSGSGSYFLTSYSSSSGSTRQNVKVPTVPVPQHCQNYNCTCSARDWE